MNILVAAANGNFSTGVVGTVQEITQFTFPAGSALVKPVKQLETATCTTASNIQIGAVATTLISCTAASNLLIATPSVYELLVSAPNSGWQNGYVAFYVPEFFDYSYFWFNIDGGGSDPAPFPNGGIEVDLTSGMNQDQVADAISSALNGFGYPATAGEGVVDWSPDISGFNYDNEPFVQADDPSGLFVFTIDDGTAGSYFVTPEGDAFICVVDGNEWSLGDDFADAQFELDFDSTQTAAQVASNVVDGILEQGLGYTAVLSGLTNVIAGNSDSDTGSWSDVSTGWGFTPHSSLIPSGYFKVIDGAFKVETDVYFVIDGIDIRPADIGQRFLGVNISAVDSASTIATKLASAMNTKWLAETINSTTVEWQYNFSALVTDVPVNGAPTGLTFTLITAPVPSPYFQFIDPRLGTFNGWFNVDGSGFSPGGNSMEMDVSSGSTSTFVAMVAATAFQAKGFTVSRTTNVNTVTNPNKGAAPDAVVIIPIGTGFSILVTQQGK